MFQEGNILGWIFEKVVIVMVAYFVLSIFSLFQEGNIGWIFEKVVIVMESYFVLYIFSLFQEGNN